MNRKKETYIRKGARVRVADLTLEGAERWHNARLGTVAESSNATALLHVLLDGDPVPLPVLWSDVDVEQKPRHGQIDLPISSIRPSRWQHRRRWAPASLQELAQSIQEVGLINRLLVFRDEDGDTYEIIAGERRFRALAALALVDVGDTDRLDRAVRILSSDWTHLAGVLENLPGTVPCELRDGTAADFREIVIVENLQRENCTAVEEAEAFQTLIQEEHYTHASLAQRLGKSRAYITQRLGLLGLAEGVRDSVDDNEISFTAARSIATLPEAVQPAVAAHVQDLASKEGDSQATTRKVQAMARQINTFLDIHTWDPGPEVIAPLIRNRLRLVRHHLERLDAERTGEAVVALRQSASPYGYGPGDNLVGKKPLTLVQDPRNVAAVLSQLTGQRDMTTDEFWAAAAHDRNWLCVYCVFYGHTQPAEVKDAPHCLRWDGQDVATCTGFIAHDDPLVIPLGYHLVRWADQLGVPYLGRLLGGGKLAYLDDIDVYADLQELAAAGSHEKAAQQEMAQTQAHLPALRSYCGAQAEKKLARLLWSFGHVQAHRCALCVHHRPELADQNLPPCHFAIEPLSSQFGNETVAPAMGALVSQDGLLVPRCIEFRHRAPPQILPLDGFRFPSSKEGRAVVLHWLRTIAGRGSSENNHISNCTLNHRAGELIWYSILRHGVAKGSNKDCSDGSAV